jgi:hypothetical protein
MYFYLSFSPIQMMIHQSILRVSKVKKVKNIIRNICLQSDSPSTLHRRREQTREDLNESDTEINGHDDDEQSILPSQSSEKPNKRRDDNEDDTFLERFQQQQRKREKLETKAKISHRVFCPFYPEV